MKFQKIFSLDNAPDGLKPDGRSTGDIAAIDGTEPITLYLSSNKKRIVKLVAPLTISNVEYQRICTWIKATLIVEENNSTMNFG